MRDAVEREVQWTFHVGDGSLCLDFANTVSWRGSGTPVDHLPSYGELIRFARQVGVVSETEARRLRRAAARRPEAATRVWRDARELREALYRTFAGLATGRPLLPRDLAIVNARLPAALVHLQIAPTDDRFGWGWAGDPQALDRLLWPVARDAAVFLTSADLSRLRACANPNCRWIFLDTSRNSSRRWCRMAVCGNRSKVQRYRKRQQHS